MKRLVMVAKSPWHPAIRREHALASEARRNGLHVDFIEAPNDIRQLRGGDRRAWLAGLRTLPPQRSQAPAGAFTRSTLVPGHRGRLAAAVDNRLLRRTVLQLCRAAEPRDVAVVVNVPWQWDATAGAGGRRVFDAADDWNLLLGGKRPHVRRMYHRIGAEADRVIVANENLAALFGGRAVDLVPNGTQSGLVADAVRRNTGARRIVYVGTFSERFDADLMSAVLRLLPDWKLDLYGEFRYAGLGSSPAPEFNGLLAEFGTRVTWHGVLQRAGLGPVLAGAGIAVVPHRARYCRGQSSMKFLDYAAGGCPVVSTRWETGIERQAPPGVWFADTPAEFAAAVRVAGDMDGGTARQAIGWAREQTWERRWPAWSGAVFGTAAGRAA
jgi:glycosyltransferase involved in cell wall biosynthesis